MSELLELKRKLEDLSVTQNSSATVTGVKNASVMDQKSTLPSVPQWMLDRPYFSLDYPSDPDAEDLAFNILGPVPVESQEHLVVEDLLYVLSGVDGEYIITKLENGVRTFTVDETMNISLKEMVMRFMPICSDYSAILRFTEDQGRYDRGLVSQALSAALNVLIKDYLLFLAQLETEHIEGSLSLQKMYYQIQPSSNVLALLASISEDLLRDKAKGGMILSYLHVKASKLIGNAKSQEICIFLLEAASKPYFNILRQWILRGLIKDPYCEFLVEDHDTSKFQGAPLSPAYSDDYWEKRYSIKADRVPVFLEKFGDKILRTGKYLNVLRQCVKLISIDSGKDIAYKYNDSKYLEVIEEAYSVASKNLLDHLMKHEDLMGRLKSMKHYFFMEAGDFLLQFQQITESELLKNADDIVLLRLEPLLELALRTSSANADPYKDDLKIDLLTFDLQTQINKIANAGTPFDQYVQYDNPTDRLTLTGFQSFTFNYAVGWPVSLVLNRSVIACYQMIFRHLFFVKYVETLLCRVWMANKFVRNFSQSTAQSYTTAFALRQRMLNFVQSLEYYITLEVIEVHWVKFLADISLANNVDDVLHLHSDLLNKILADGMVIFTDVLSTLTKLLNVCEQFSNFMIAQQNAQPSSTSDTFEETIKKYDLQFSALLGSFIERVTAVQFDASNERRVALLDRLNYNSFYDHIFQMGRSVFLNGATSEAEEAETTTG